MRWLKALAGLTASAAASGGAFALYQAAAFDASVERDYRIAPLAIQAVDDNAVIARGKHIADTFGGCTGCHGDDLGGKAGENLGPLADVPAPNLTRGSPAKIGA